MNEAYCQLFLRETRHGILAGVKLPPPTDDLHVSPLLTEKEKEHVLWLPVLRRAAWMGGRVALRLAARHFGIELDSVFSTHRGAPSLPPGLVASISHKRRIAVALLARSSTFTVGVDVEELDRPRPKIARLVLRTPESHRIENLPHAQRWPAIITTFSIKESIFKAIDPIVQRYVGFHEAEVEILPHGDSHIALYLNTLHAPFEIDGRWQVFDSHVVTSVRLRPASLSDR
ncbi:MAG TPA: 4'-phosphopantetheinyl transferase superfamily protein [Polyangiaceae bacterium]|jgi:4'-phosphopantetheinyl transferase EntD|nr:MAG: 4'-phosphopantetheinyl transferase Npt [Deltaproteobacteria bacterium ADurb.Bin207]HNS96850.1 4'-phosphopantetheinyl transferase superfamily protein [Polyangiaceae bacterium]HNZ20997.1 4'-phosphopantetheinyl transferase superfamily protein [Polyangiaceae bacterium]HOD23854.1 4'-phosphopantetheinyl transferase superfamily protein [Polyangiaceae bacterium]HOE48841.1 4'-phosphopantetheinyl transferase superfamily protein [Polyangiaceae bacterium]